MNIKPAVFDTDGNEIYENYRVAQTDYENYTIGELTLIYDLNVTEWFSYFVLPGTRREHSLRNYLLDDSGPSMGSK